MSVYHKCTYKAHVLMKVFARILDRAAPQGYHCLDPIAPTSLLQAARGRKMPSIGLIRGT